MHERAYIVLTAVLLYVVGAWVLGWVGGWDDVRACAAVRSTTASSAAVVLLYMVHACGCVANPPIFSSLVVLQRCGSWPYVLIRYTRRFAPLAPATLADTEELNKMLPGTTNG